MADTARVGATTLSTLPAIGCFALGLLVATPSCAEYLLRPGDVLEMSAVGVPDLRQKTTIDPEGNAFFPLIGQTSAAGRTIADVRKKVQQLLPSKVFRRRDPDGHESAVLISPDEVEVRVAEYRPVYLSGDVSKPGAQAYRPGLTVRQAVSLAGGYDIMRFRMSNPFLESADLKSQYEAAWTEAAKEDARIARIKAELAGDARLDTGSLEQTPVPGSVARKIVDLETQQLEANRNDRDREAAYLQKAVAEEENRISLLNQQQSQEQEGTKADNDEYENVRQYFQKGMVPLTRVTEARRLTLLSSTRVLQTNVELAQATRERQTLGRKLERLDDERRMKLLTEYQDATVRLAELHSRVATIGDKIAYTSMVRSQLVRGDKGKPDLVIHRDTEPGAAIAAQEDTPLMPGDVVEVSLQSLYAPTTAAAGSAPSR